MPSSSLDAPASALAPETRLLLDEAHDCERQSRREEARALYEQALRQLKVATPTITPSAIVRWIARTYLSEARYDEARDCIDLSMVLAELAGDGAGVGHSVNQLAVLHWHLGDLDAAKRLYLAAREHATRSDDAALVAMTSTNLGVIASVRGEHEQALRYFESSLREYRLLGMARDVAIALNNVGMVQTRLEQHADAERAYREALTVARTTEEVEIVTQLEINLAKARLKQGDFDESRRLVERALLAAQAHQLGDALGGAYELSGAIARAQGDLPGALESLSRALEVATHRGNTLLIAEVEHKRSQVFRQLGRNRDALQSLNTAHRHYTRLQAVRDLNEIAQQTRGLEAEFLELARRWGESTESKDRYTQGHCERVADVSCRLAAAAGLGDTELLWFRIGALLHDVGKLIVPSDVLNKPGRLTPDEWALIKRHPIAGVELLSEVEFPWDILPIVRSHHECWDGSGYPDGLVGEEIPMVARIVCLADVYDALTTERSYKRALPHAEAIEVMRRDVGRQFDPALFDRFEALMRESAGEGPSTARTERRGGRSGRSATDELTGLPTRRPFIELARQRLEAASAQMPVALAVIDVDHFKTVNDTFGHLTGDSVLEAVAKLLTQECRAIDVVGRYAGDEFVVLLPEADIVEATRICERMRQGVSSQRIPVRGTEERWVGVSLSIGVAVAPLDGETFEALFAAADRALYNAKRRGRNGVATAGRDGDTAVPRLNVQQFVGRAGEVARLRERVEACARGEPGVVAVIGEAGVGKTTLVQRMSSEVRLRTGTFITARALEPDVRPPFGLWSDVISQLHQTRIVPDRSWPQLSRLVPAMRGESATVADDTVHGDSKYALLDELVAYVRTAAASRPLLIALDDVQWADHASWEALEHLVASLDHDRLLICLTVRREDAQQFEGSRRRLSRDERYGEIRLERLSPTEVGEWLTDALHQATDEGELADFLYRYTEGNPLFVVQVLQTLVDEGVLWYNGREWEWQGVDHVQLPAAVDDLLARRLGRLAPATSHAMTTAAVIGRAFDFDLLRHVTELEEDALIDVLDEAVSAGVLDPAADRTGNRYQFAHTLLSDALIRHANPRRVRRMHARVAEVLEGQRPEALNEIAVHFDAAGDDGRAFAYALRAGERAARMYALSDAIASYSIAVRRAPSAPERLKARLALVDVARIAGQLETAHATCEAARAELAPEDAVSRLRVARRGLQLQLLQARNPHEVVQEGRILLETARAIDAVEETILILSTVADAHTRLSQRPEAERAARLATAEAERFGDDLLVADARLRLGAALLERAPQESLVEFDEARQRFAARGNRFGVIRCLVNAGIARARLGDAAAAEREYESARRAADAANIPDLGGLAALNLGVLHQKVGNYEQAQQTYAYAERMFAKVHNDGRRLAAMYNSANLAREQGDTVAAHARYERVYAMACELSVVDIEVGSIAGSGLASLDLGNIDQALLARRRAAERSATLGDTWFQGRELWEALEVRYLVATDRAIQAAEVFEKARALAASIDEGAALWLVAECAPALSRAGVGDFGDLVHQAWDRATTFGLRPLAARLAAQLR